MAYQTPLTVRETLDRIHRDRLLLPAIQREFVWVSDPDRMARLFDSLLRQYPIGTFLFWNVPAAQSRTFDFYRFLREWHERDHRHNDRFHMPSAMDVTAVLDGQQRLTTLNIGLFGSIAQRGRYQRVASPHSYPARYLYVDLLHEPNEDEDVEYRFAFLTPEQAVAGPETHWFLVPKIVDMPDAARAAFHYLLAHGLQDRARPFDVLSRLWEAVHKDPVVAYFEERGETLTRVLDIFVRVNSGGVVLSKSDLLLSVATAQFATRDAREEIHRLVDELNSEGDGFAVTKDLVLKAGLLLTGISDIGFRVENFTRENMSRLEQEWDRVAHALRVAVRLLASFGFSKETLPASSIVIPLADYVFQRRLDGAYVESLAEPIVQDRRAVKDWTIRTILMPGVWGSGLDGLLRGMHRALLDNGPGFPVEAIEAEMAKRGKTLTFDDSLLDDLVDSPYRHPRAFALLSLLYDSVDSGARTHVDHVFPRSLATTAKLRVMGVPEADVEAVRDAVERLPNLQLLRGTLNIDKRAALPAEWVRERFPEERAREAWLAESDLLGLPDGFSGFLAFYQARRKLMRQRLAALLRGERTQGAAFEAPSPELRTIARRAPAGAAPGAGADVGRSRRRFEETLLDLIADGRLAPGDVLRARFRHVEHEAVIERDGMRVGNRVHESPSAASSAVNGGVADNGWQRWVTERGVPIGELRRR